MANELHPDQVEAWTRVGLLMTLLQNVEHAFGEYLTIMAHEDPFGLQNVGNAFAFYESLTSDRKQTLGAMINKFLRGTQISGKNRDWISKFLEDRNLFIHRFFLNEMHDLNKLENVTRVRIFVDDLTQRSIAMKEFLETLVDEWAERHGLESTETDA